MFLYAYEQNYANKITYIFVNLLFFTDVGILVGRPAAHNNAL